jgi:hypothetical protein
MSDQIIIVQEPVTNVNVVAQPVPNLIVNAPGPQGPPVQIFYVHTQGSPSAVWTINHNLNGQPTAVVLDSAGTQCEGTFSYPSVNQMVITFTAAFSGTAYII